MLFVQGLRQRQCAARRKTKTTIGFALQAGEVVQQRRCLGGRLGFFRHGAGFARAIGDDFFRFGFVPNALCALMLAFFACRFFEFRCKPPPGIITRFGTKACVHFPIVFGLELFDLFFTLGNQRQRWRLHTANRSQIKAAFFTIEGSHRARAVDADQPIGLGAAFRGIRQRQHFFVAAQR